MLSRKGSNFPKYAILFSKIIYLAFIFLWLWDESEHEFFNSTS